MDDDHVEGMRMPLEAVSKEQQKEIQKLSDRIERLQDLSVRVHFLENVLRGVYWQIQRLPRKEMSEGQFAAAKELLQEQIISALERDDHASSAPNPGDAVATGIAVRRDCVGGGGFPDLSQFGPRESE